MKIMHLTSKSFYNFTLCYSGEKVLMYKMRRHCNDLLQAEAGMSYCTSTAVYSFLMGVFTRMINF